MSSNNHNDDNEHRRIASFSFSWTQPWKTQGLGNFCDFTVGRLEARARTFDILVELDNLEKEVYADREYTLANELINRAIKNKGK